MFSILQPKRPISLDLQSCITAVLMYSVLNGNQKTTNVWKINLFEVQMILNEISDRYLNVRAIVKHNIINRSYCVTIILISIVQ